VISKPEHKRTPVQKDCARLTLIRFSSVGRAPTSATEPSMQLNLESGTICRRTSDSRTCQTAVSDSRWSPKTFYLVSGPKVQCESPFKLRFENSLTYLQYVRQGSVTMTTKSSKAVQQHCLVRISLVRRTCDYI